MEKLPKNRDRGVEVGITVMKSSPEVVKSKPNDGVGGLTERTDS